jgi:hypothetical protein
MAGLQGQLKGAGNRALSLCAAAAMVWTLVNTL